MYTEGYASSAATELASRAMLSETRPERGSKSPEGVGRFTPRSQSHRDQPPPGSYYLIAAQIDDCLAPLKLMFTLRPGTKGVFPPRVLSSVAE